MAVLTASPNPVGVEGAGQTGTTTVSWNTQSSSPGRVYLAVDGAAPILFAGGTAGARTGSKQQSVTHGRTYVFTLRQVSNNALLATLTVTVVDLQEERIKATLAALELRDRLDPPQAITGLQAIPGVDTVDLSFRTNRPTIPLVKLFAEDGSELAAWFPLFGGLRTVHRAVLGLSTPLPQGTEITVRITAAGRPNLFGQARDRVLEARIRTGTRVVDMLFDTITVQNDGDPGIKASGEFRFSFMAADAGSEVDVWAASYDGDISGGDPPRLVDRSVILVDGPREVYARVHGKEHDFGIPAPGQGLNITGMLGFRGVGSDGSEDVDGPKAWVARVFDVSRHGPGFHQEPFSMRTAPLGIDFTVDGRIATIVRPGRGAFTLRLEPYRPDAVRLLREGAAMAGPPGPGGRSLMVGRGDDGAIWQRLGPAGRREEGWARLAPDPGGPVTALVTGEGAIELVAVAESGEALRWRDGGWRPLGGRFAGAIEAAPDGAGGAHLLALDRDGRVHRGGLDGGWEVIGEAVAGELQAIAVGERGLAVLAIDREGRALHAGSRDGRALGRLEPLGGPRAVLLGGHALDGGGIEVAVLDADDLVQVLAWPDWPRQRRRPRWEPLGERDLLTPARPLAVPCPRPREPDDPCAEPIATPAARRRRARP